MKTYTSERDRDRILAIQAAQLLPMRAQEDYPSDLAQAKAERTRARSCLRMALLLHKRAGLGPKIAERFLVLCTSEGSTFESTAHALAALLLYD